MLSKALQKNVDRDTEKAVKIHEKKSNKLDEKH